MKIHVTQLKNHAKVEASSEAGDTVTLDQLYDSYGLAGPILCVGFEAHTVDRIDVPAQTAIQRAEHVKDQLADLYKDLTTFDEYDGVTGARR